MKSFGSKLAFTRERNVELFHAFRMEASRASYIKLSEIGENIVNYPCSRFWVSEERAVTVVSAIMRGKPILDTMRPTKREMFEEIYKRVCVLKEKHSDWRLCDLVSCVVNSPAPKFYMETSSAIELLFKIRKGWYDK